MDYYAFVAAYAVSTRMCCHQSLCRAYVRMLRPCSPGSVTSALATENCGVAWLVTSLVGLSVIGRGNENKSLRHKPHFEIFLFSYYTELTVSTATGISNNLRGFTW